MGEELITVRLDMTKVLTGANVKYTLAIAEALLNICGIAKIWEEPNHGHRIFYVRVMPQDVPQAGVYWIDAAEFSVINPYESPFLTH